MASSAPAINVDDGAIEEESPEMPPMGRVPTRYSIAPKFRKTNGGGIQPENNMICVVMVGLPARGKSLIAQKGGDSGGTIMIRD